MRKNFAGKPAFQENALTKFLDGLEETTQDSILRVVYTAFFASAPAGLHYFKQSKTRLHFIAGTVVIITLDMFADPKRMTQHVVRREVYTAFFAIASAGQWLPPPRGD